MMISLDGYFEGPNGDISWHNVDDEFNEQAIAMLDQTDTLLFGRVTYDLMAGYWPTEQARDDDPRVAERMNRLEKVVVSRTLDKAEWNNTRLIKENVVEEIQKLKQQPGKNIAILGSSNLTASLLPFNIVDELLIYVSPVLLGGGKKLFDGLQKQIELTLIETRKFKSGNVDMRYVPTKKGNV